MVALVGAGGCTKITPEVCLIQKTIAVMLCCAVFFVHFPAFGSFDIMLTYKVCVKDHFLHNTLQIFACCLNIFRFMFYTALELPHVFTIFLCLVVYFSLRQMFR